MAAVRHGMGFIDLPGISMRNPLLAFMGAAVPPDERSSERHQLDVKVRNPWSSGIDMAYVDVGGSIWWRQS